MNEKQIQKTLMLGKVQIFIIWSLSHIIMDNLKKKTGYRSISPEGLPKKL